MMGFDLRISGVRSDRSINRATTTAHQDSPFIIMGENGGRGLLKTCVKVKTIIDAQQSFILISEITTLELALYHTLI